MFQTRANADARVLLGLKCALDELLRVGQPDAERVLAAGAERLHRRRRVQGNDPTWLIRVQVLRLVGVIKHGVIQFCGRRAAAAQLRPHARGVKGRDDEVAATQVNGAN